MTGWRSMTVAESAGPATGAHLGSMFLASVGLPVPVVGGAPRRWCTGSADGAGMVGARVVELPGIGWCRCTRFGVDAPSPRRVVAGQDGLWIVTGEREVYVSLPAAVLIIWCSTWVRGGWVSSMAVNGVVWLSAGSNGRLWPARSGVSAGRPAGRAKLTRKRSLVQTQYRPPAI